MQYIKRKAIIKAVAGLLFINMPAFAYDEGCPPCPTCAPCGEVITNMPLPTLDNNRVQPFQNYVATYESCMASGWNGLYFGTGFGYGVTNYNLKIAGITLPTTNNQTFSDSYIIEYVTVGYAHSTNRFFIGVELGYYYDSVTSPIFYEDPSVVTVVSPGIPLLTLDSTVIARPCTIRLDINAHNHAALDLLPGFVLTPRLTLFGRVGFEYSNYTWTRRTCAPQVLVDTAAGPPATVIVDVNDPAQIVFFNNNYGDITDAQSDAVIDFRLGAGVSFAAGRHLSFNINYIHVFGSSGSFTPNIGLYTANNPVIDFPFAPAPAPPPATNLTTLAAVNTIDPSRNEILFGIVVSL